MSQTPTFVNWKIHFDKPLLFQFRNDNEFADSVVGNSFHLLAASHATSILFNPFEPPVSSPSPGSLEVWLSYRSRVTFIEFENK